MLEKINAVMWAIATALILLYGIYFSVKLSFPQYKIKNIKKALNRETKKGITPIKTLFLTLAGRIGVGSIAGVALAIYIGGPGTIFWMWIIAFISAALAYAETLLAIKYQVKDKECYGGPFYYIKNGLKNKKLAKMYAFILLIAYIIGFIPIQTNTITKSLDSIMPIDHLLLGIIISIISFIIIKGGIKKITKFSNIIIPLITIFYVFLALFAILKNLENFHTVFKLIFTEAFNLKPFFSGFIPTVLIGVQRGIFSNEAGLGIGTIAACASVENNPKKSAFIQILGIYLTTIVICTATAIIVLTSNYQDILLTNPNGIEITTSSFAFHFGNLGKIILILLITIFAFSTVLTGHYYCEISLKFLSKKININIIKFSTIISIFIGTLTSPNLIWNFIDILVATLAIINIYTLVKLKGEIMQTNKKYDKI